MPRGSHLAKTSIQLDLSDISEVFLSGRITVIIATLMLFILYPFTYLYRYHMAIGNLPRFMDNIYGVMTLVAALLLGCYFITTDASRLRRSTAVISVLFYIFVAYTFMWVLIHYLLADDIIGSYELFSYYTRIILDYYALFLIGFYFRPEKWGNLFFLVFLIICINALFHMNWDRIMIDLRNVVYPGYDQIYLGLSNAALISGLLAWSGIKKPFFRLMVLALMIPLLFVNNSRADLAAFIIVLPVAIYFTLRPVWQVIIYSGSTFFFLLSATIIGWDKLAVSRHFQIFGMDQFTSLTARNVFLIWGLERIISSPIIGDYGGTLAERGTIGSYIHNLLSVWQAFGLIPFLIYAFLVLVVVYFGFKLFIKNGRTLDRQAQLIIVFGLIATIEIILAKSVAWSHIALVWGLMAGWTQRSEKALILSRLKYSEDV